MSNQDGPARQMRSTHQGMEPVAEAQHNRTDLFHWSTKAMILAYRCLQARCWSTLTVSNVRTGFHGCAQFMLVLLLVPRNRALLRPYRPAPPLLLPVDGDTDEVSRLRFENGASRQALNRHVWGCTSMAVGSRALELGLPYEPNSTRRLETGNQTSGGRQKRRGACPPSCRSLLCRVRRAHGTAGYPVYDGVRSNGWWRCRRGRWYEGARRRPGDGRRKKRDSPPKDSDESAAEAVADTLGSIKVLNFSSRNHKSEGG
ncbi:hypothetical protein CALVIDRAFT_392736 [Calocera viscosa TUFC12733]|uniref:Uncharacterized protein n=1 Tax=Calocera viscosa (strain TUFC12733) TaxID=1330018 RepID=A0A167GEB0_CALVF|nr:hypothetical protein CALVIDRAFT_392736 [Calocera viscosa TUFC12733]